MLPILSKELVKTNTNSSNVLLKKGKKQAQQRTEVEKEPSENRERKYASLQESSHPARKNTAAKLSVDCTMSHPLLRPEARRRHPITNLLTSRGTVLSCVLGAREV